MPHFRRLAQSARSYTERVPRKVWLFFACLAWIWLVNKLLHPWDEPQVYFGLLQGVAFIWFATWFLWDTFWPTISKWAIPVFDDFSGKTETGLRTWEDSLSQKKKPRRFTPRPMIYFD